MGQGRWGKVKEGPQDQPTPPPRPWSQAGGPGTQSTGHACPGHPTFLSPHSVYGVPALSQPQTCMPLRGGPPTGPNFLLAMGKSLSLGP